MPTVMRTGAGTAGAGTAGTDQGAQLPMVDIESWVQVEVDDAYVTVLPQAHVVVLKDRSRVTAIE